MTLNVCFKLVLEEFHRKSCMMGPEDTPMVRNDAYAIGAAMTKMTELSMPPYSTQNSSSVLVWRRSKVTHVKNSKEQ